MSNLCIIPARGGSKRIPKKNIKDFLGKPIIAYSIEAALKSKLFDEVMVSTDEEEIAKISKTYGASVPFMRSKKNSDDFATTYDVIEEVINQYKKKEIEFENICCIYPCAPLIKIEKLVESFYILNRGKYSSVIPIVTFGYPIQRAFKITNGEVSYFYPEFEHKRSQDLEKLYHDAGQFYFVKTKELLKQKTLITKNTTYIELKETEVEDIDNLTDWKLAELKYKFDKTYYE